MECQATFWFTLLIWDGDLGALSEFSEGKGWLPYSQLGKDGSDEMMDGLIKGLLTIGFP